ncbi:protein unc-13 homolog 4B isoform X1 [Amyelois transitella]|uniref:protein unc-13 homolog 4B isoform X1 n=1 Tax=Amyelois transitella TaxID=680683 RepID=UPI00298FF261|nr:protein unc-13 homolog 4B isoform X1 [Amyelois transitella]XP_060801528.1 protein unc-13 homolog 4B isoform X1 [Amyelois transitella]
MPELGPMMRTLELQRLIEDKVSEWRARSARVSGGASVAESYQQSHNFKRHTNRRKNSAEINRIIAKYSKPIKRTDERYCTSINKPETPPTRPPRTKRISKIFSKSEDNLANVVDIMEPHSSPTKNKSSFFKYNAKSYEDITAFVDVDRNVKSKNFKENSILNEKKLPKNIRPKLYSISEDKFDYSVFSDRNVNVNKQNEFVTSTPLSERKSCPPVSETVPVNGFEKCTNYNSVNDLRKGSSEPDILSINSRRDTLDSSKNGDKKRWSLLRPQFPRAAFDAILKWRGKKPRKEERKESSRKIQEVDDSFFEKFGSILKQASQRAALEEATPLAPFKEVEEQDSERNVDEDSQIESQSLADSGLGTLVDADSEPGDLEKIDLYEEAVGWNIDELYLEILYEILHNVGGCDASSEVGPTAMLSYVQEAFKISNDKHKHLLTTAEAKEPPELMLNVEVVEAKDLMPKDPNGMSDPFVTIYLMSNTAHRYNTSVKSTTLNPVWEEHFSLPMPGNLQEDSLCLEVWDFDPAETVKEKMTKLFDVKGVKGLRKLMKEIAITASTGKHDNELIGTANIPLNSIPAHGMTMWFNLSKKSKLRRQGVVKVRLGFSSEKNSQVAAQEHRHLLRILLLHELENSKVAPYWWCGNFSAPAEAIIIQHAAQSGLSAADNALAQWAVYCAVTVDHPLSFALFTQLLEKITKPLQSGLVKEEDVKLFWDGAKKLLPTCFSYIRKLRKKTAGEKTAMKTLREVLHILYNLSVLDAPESIELFPVNSYGWLRTEGKKLDINEVLNQAVLQGASDWFVHILDNNECKEKTEESRLEHLIRVIQLVRSDLQRALEYYDRVFVETMNFPYSKALYGLYEQKIASLVEPEAKEVCKSLKRLQYDEGSTKSVHLAGGINGETRLGDPKVDNEPLAMGTTLFQLYLTLQRFLTLGQGLNETDWNSYAISKFHSWFFGGVAQWLEIAAYKALTRVEKAVELDNLVPVDANVKYSSSGVDTLAIFYQIKIFWQQLAWPDVEGCYTFVAKIIDDICRCCVFYSEKMAGRVDNIGVVTTVYEERFEVTTEWCVAINNIDYVRQSLRPFAEELGMDEIIEKMCETRTPAEAQRCKDTLHNVISNAIDTVKNNIVDLLAMMVKRMIPSITRLLLEGAELLHQDCSSMDRVMRYIEANLDTLYQHLNNENFSRTLDIVWEQLGDVLYELIQSNLENRRPKVALFKGLRLSKATAAFLVAKRRPPSFFSNLHECLKIMIQSFRQDSRETYTSETLKRVEYLLKIHGMETRELIHQYHLERWQEQQAITEPKMGMLTVRAQFMEDNLKLEIMNARNLVPTDSNGLCDSYVRVALLPEDTFANIVKPKTQTHNKNLFPLYDEMFLIPLSHEQRNTQDGLLHMVIKDKDMFSVSNTFVGEAYLHFSEVPDTPAPITSLPQQHLPLTKPNSIDGDAIKALESRQGDKQAREFLKKQRQKLPSKQFFSLG